MRADEILSQGAQTFREKNGKYGSNYTKVGKIMAILFPEGIELRTEYDHLLYHEMSWLIGKLTRFCSTEEPMTDLDSINDMMVYCAIVEMLLREENKNVGQE